MESSVVIQEVGPRDGLQNEPTVVSTHDKLKWLHDLVQAGITRLELTSFVNPAWIPALADAEEVVKAFGKPTGVTRSALVPNLRGLERALSVGIDEIAVFVSASETHNLKNCNKSIADTFSVLQATISDAKSAGLPVRGYVSTVFGCPYEGSISIEDVARVTSKLFELGVYEVSLGDTIGVATPMQVSRVLAELLQEFPADRLAMHFHDTRGMAVANVWESYQAGIRVFDSACGGLGGCPYAPGASGNVATEDLVYLFAGAGIDTGISLAGIVKAASCIQTIVGHALPSRNLRAQGGNGGD